MVDCVCAVCGSLVKVYPSKVRQRNYCSVSCRNKAMSQRNRENNPSLMTPEVREKLRAARLNPNATSYEKTYGRHTHRVVAESILGRPLRKGEVVHHIDLNKRNNKPENLIVFRTQAEHVRYHNKGGDLNDFQATRLSDLRHPVHS